MFPSIESKCNVMCLQLPGHDGMQVLKQSFFIDTAVKAMGVSSTMHGISSKFLLLGTLSDQVQPKCLDISIYSKLYL